MSRFALLTVALLALAVSAQAQGAAAPAPAPQELPAPAPSPAGTELPADLSTTPALTAEEVAKHNTLEDCWYINEGMVYDVTQFMAEDLHPDGNEVILPFCGKDATQEFNRQHRGSRAREEQATYLLGPLAV